MPKRKRKNDDDDWSPKGVTKTKSGRFQAQIRIDGKKQYLGSFDTPKEAARAYDRAAMQAGRPPTTLNYQDKVPMDYKAKKKKLRSDNTIGYRGVSKMGNRFIAYITIGDTNYHIGCFDTTKEAAIAYDLAAIQAKRPKSDLNFPDMIHVKKVKTKKIKKIKKKKVPISTTKVDVKYKGVYKNGKGFRAAITVDSQLYTLGTFDTAEKAARAYDRAAMQAGRPPTTLNFQDKVPMDYKAKKKKLMSTNTIGYRGVSKMGNRFRARIQIGDRFHHIGLFGTKKEAAIAYDLAAIQTKRPKSDLNFPDMIHVKKVKTRIKKKKSKR